MTVRYSQLPTFSPDGSRIYFLGTHEDGSRGVWWIPANGGDATKVAALDDPSLMLFKARSHSGSGEPLSHDRRVRERHLGDGSRVVRPGGSRVCKNVCKVGVTKGVKAAADFHTPCDVIRRSTPFL